MKTINKSIGSFEAKTHLSSLIEKVQKGSEFVITKRGRPVAKLIPFAESDDSVDMNDLLLKFDSIRNSVKGKIKIKEFINEGRKY